MPIADYVKISILLICILVCNLTWYIASFILFPAYTTFLTLEVQETDFGTFSRHPMILMISNSFSRFFSTHLKS